MARSTANWRRCGAKCRNGSACKSPAMRGGARCRMHGGAAPQTIAAAGRRLALRELEQGAAASRYGDPKHADPVTALEDEIARTRGAISYLHDAILQMGEKELLRRVTESRSAEFDGPSTITIKIETIENGWVRLLLRERKHLADLLSLAFRVQLAERRVAITHEHANRLNAAIGGILSDLGHNLSDPHVRKVVADNLRALAEPKVETESEIGSESESESVSGAPSVAVVM